MPDSEMEQIDYFDGLPDKLTYPDIALELFSRAKAAAFA
jgi:hypothetical protein